MKRKKIFLLILFLQILSYSAESISFRALVELASKDIKKNIYLDKDIKDYEMVLNLAKYQQKGEFFELFESILEENSYSLKYNQKGFYTVVGIGASTQASFPPLNPATKIHFYTYKVKNLTGEEVASAFSVMPNLVYKYLPKSDMIAYSATKEQHSFLKLSLSSTDNTVHHKSIKITIFYTDYEKLQDLGTKISSLGIDLDNIITKSKSNTFSDVSYSLTNSIEFKGYISSLARKGYIDIKQSPTMLLTSGVPTSFKSVKTIPFINSTTTIEDTKESKTEDIQYKDIGLQVFINPKIKKDTVYLDLNLTVEELLDLNSNKPITQKISYMNSVKLSKDAPVLLTGLKKEVLDTTVQTTPIFKNIPIFQDIFKHKSSIKKTKDLNILIEVI